MPDLRTERLQMVPFTLELIRAALRDTEEMGIMLGCESRHAPQRIANGPIQGSPMMWKLPSFLRTTFCLSCSLTRGATKSVPTAAQRPKKGHASSSKSRMCSQQFPALSTSKDLVYRIMTAVPEPVLRSLLDFKVWRPRFR